MLCLFGVLCFHSRTPSLFPTLHFLAIHFQIFCSNERQQLVEERDVALEQLRWMEASRDELARQQGQYKGRIAKVAFSRCQDVHLMQCARFCF